MFELHYYCMEIPIYIMIFKVELKFKNLLVLEILYSVDKNILVL